MASNNKRKSLKTTLKEGVSTIVNLWDQQPGDYFCFSTNTDRGRWLDHFIKPDDFDDVPKFIQSQLDHDIYFCPHGFSRRRRKKEYAVLPQVLWSDLDEADPRTIQIKPTMAFESSPNRYVGLWRTNETIDETTNRALNYFIGADKSGWDLTQVLRVPGTINYKYNSMPTVKILWTDGPEWDLDEIKKKLPRASTSKTNTSIEIDADRYESKAVLRKYSKKLSSRAKQIARAENAKVGERSDRIFELIANLHEAGATPDEIAAVVWGNVNFIDKHGDDERRLEAEINRCLNKLQIEPKGRNDSPFVNLADVEAQDVDWLWEPLIPYGMVSIVEGDPGEGKSYLAMYIAAQISIGGKLPGIEKVHKGKILYLTAEDDPSYTIRPRIDAMGGDPSKIMVQTDYLTLDDAGWKSLMAEVDRWEPDFIVFDPLFAYVPSGQDVYRPNVIRPMFSRFKDIATQSEAAILVVRHLTKAKHEKAIYQGGGSMDVIGAVRSTIRVMKNPEDPSEKLILHIKFNNSARGKTWVYKLVPQPDGQVPTLEWVGASDLTIDDVMANPSHDQASALDDAVDFLRSQLKDGPRLVKKVERDGELRGYSKRTLDRARKALGVKSEKGSKGWVISLPPEE